MKRFHPPYTVSTTLFLLLLSALTVQTNCTTYTNTSSKYSQSFGWNVTACTVRNLRLVKPTVGLSIGISNYQDQAMVFSTPAHTIGAALFLQPFYSSALLERYGLKNPIHYRHVIPGHLNLFAADKESIKRDLEFGFEESERLFSNLELLTDLRLNPYSPEAPLTEAILYEIDGAREKLNIFLNRDAKKLDKEGKWNFIGNGEYISSTDIFDAINRMLSKAKSVYENEGDVLVLFYISAHGLIGEDGHRYLLPGDAIAQERSTWISYESILEPIFKFLEQQPTYIDAILVFDSCQKPIKQPSESDMLEFSDIPGGVIMIHSTSPGQYSWHWTNSPVVDVNVDRTKKKRGFMRFPTTNYEQFDLDSTYWTTMSVVPAASVCAMKYLESDPISYSTFQYLNHQPDTIYGISAYDWIEELNYEFGYIIDDIPEVKELATNQDMQIFVGDPYMDFDLFDVVDSAYIQISRRLEKSLDSLENLRK